MAAADTLKHTADDANDVWECWWCYDGWHPAADRWVHGVFGVAGTGRRVWLSKAAGREPWHQRRSDAPHTSAIQGPLSALPTGCQMLLLHDGQYSVAMPNPEYRFPSLTRKPSPPSSPAPCP